MLLPTGDVLLDILERVAVADVLSVGSTCRPLRDLTNDDLFWQRLAQRKWGHHAIELRPADDGCTWKAFTVKRMNLRTIRRSPLDLGQERYPDPWMHIVCCVLCSRTSGSAIIRDTISRFFELLPSPSAVLDAPDDVITQVIHPLGLQPVRLKAVRSISRDFLATDWEDPSAFYGCGKFVADSWRIFCRGDLSGQGVEDRNLRAYVSWAKRQVSGGGSAGAVGNAATGTGYAAADDSDQEEEEARRRVQSKKRVGEATEGEERAARRARREAAAALAAADVGLSERPKRGRAAAAAVAAEVGMADVALPERPKRRRAAAAAAAPAAAVAAETRAVPEASSSKRGAKRGRRGKSGAPVDVADEEAAVGSGRKLRGSCGVAADKAGSARMRDQAAS